MPQDLVERVAGLLAPILHANNSILLALSGGVDSVVLLHLLHQLAPRFGCRLSALHVHHGISPHADTWARFCEELCDRYKIFLRVERVNIAPLRESGIEAAARTLRYATLNRQPVEFIALAHHQDDQVETLLLQMLRGAGLRGASAMPTLKQRPHTPTQLRPLLGVTRSELLAYARLHALQWLEDESNSDDAYPRNFLRHRVFPLLEQRFPAYRETLARSTRHFAEASELLDQLAQLDIQGAQQGNSLEVSRLQALSYPRAKNLLRYFLHSLGAPMPQAVQLDDMLQQLCGARQDSALLLVFGDWHLRRHRGKVYAFFALPEPDANFCMPWRGESALELAQLRGTLHFEHGAGSGLSLSKLQQAAVSIRLRRGAERIRLNRDSPTRTVKNLLQERCIPPWRRNSLPLVFCGEQLVAIPGIGIACDYRATPEEIGVTVRWEVCTA